MSNADRPVDGPVDLGRLYADRSPPPHLEERVVSEWLARAGARLPADARGAREGGGGRRPLRIGRIERIAALAASVLLFGAGWVLGQRDGRPPVDTDPRFMLLLWEPDDPAPTTASALAAEYAAWARDLAATGASVTGDELGSERTLIGPEGAADTPPGDLRLGGYFLLGAGSLDAAATVAERHPHLRNGGWIEVAPIVVR